MCQKNVFHPTGPCCGTAGLCHRFPSIDWNRAGWLLRHPGAKWAEQLYAKKSYGGPTVNFGIGDPDNGKFSYSGIMPPNSNVLFSWHTYHMPAGVFQSTNTAACQWLISCRERLCPHRYLLALVDSGGFQLTANNIVTDSIPWEMYRVMTDEDADPVTGPFGFVLHGQGNDCFSWRSILKAAECSVLPALQNAGVQVFPEESIEGGLLHRLDQARQIVSSWNPAPPYAQATAMDRAVAFTLSGGIRFGVESDQRSPFFNQLVIYEGGQFASETVDDLTTRWLVSTPWTLVSGNPDLLTFGAVLKFERTDDNDCLPQWIELELVKT